MRRIQGISGIRSRGKDGCPRSWGIDLKKRRGAVWSCGELIVVAVVGSRTNALDMEEEVEAFAGEQVAIHIEDIIAPATVSDRGRRSSIRRTGYSVNSARYEKRAVELTPGAARSEEHTSELQS